MSDEDVLARRTIALSNETVTCVEYKPPYMDSVAEAVASHESFAHCNGSRFSAEFHGESSQLAGFYTMLSGIHPAR